MARSRNSLLLLSLAAVAVACGDDGSERPTKVTNTAPPPEQPVTAQEPSATEAAPPLEQPASASLEKPIVLPRSPAPSASPHRAAETEVKEAYEELPLGAIAYPERMTMRQGKASPVTVRVSVNPRISVEGISGNVAVERAKISRFTVACLIANGDEFRLVGIQGEPTTSTVCRDTGCYCLRQTLVEDQADFEWLATPVKYGDLELHLRVAARLILGGSKEESHDVLTKEGVVSVEADIWYLTKEFIRNSWKESLASVGGVGAIWAFGRRLFARRSAPRQAGFQRSQPPQSTSWVRKLLESIRP